MSVSVFDQNKGNETCCSTGIILQGQAVSATSPSEASGTMTEELKNLEGFRVGEIQIQIFVSGKDDSGRVVGLQTLSVET
jgi:Nuclease A inhibitor-like protein